MANAAKDAGTAQLAGTAGGVGVRILTALSAEPRREVDGEKDPEAELREIIDTIPGILELIRNRSVLDFGCGTGLHAIAMAMAGASHVTGLDINERWLESARTSARTFAVEDRVDFKPTVGDEKFDVVLSFNSMEHFSEPAVVLKKMRDVVRSNGRVVIAFAPPWLSAYGAHMHHFTRVPWVHLLFSERTVMTVRNRYSTDQPARYEDVEGGLNRMTVRRFEQLVPNAGFQPVWTRLTPMKGLPVVTRVPFVREFFTTRVAAVLKPV